ncbi:uncharacterized protein LOC135095754 isoform X2 [Scylla paramamosain]|uniref:uncharacterized protein LOC135095754 isoform X2 n=1 Tax=Scylla paramamosain TaxID=85552 RepID=UPI0030832111
MHHLTSSTITTPATTTITFFTSPPSPSITENVLADFLYIFYIPFIALVGLVGNIMSLDVFLKTRLNRRGTSCFLSAMSASDTLFVLLLLFRWAFHNESFPAVRLAILDTAVGCKVVNYLYAAHTTLATWLTVAYTTERCIAVRYPLQRRALCTVRRAKCTILGVVLFTSLCNLYLLVTISKIDTFNFCGVQYQEVMTAFMVVNAVVMVVLPFLLIVIMNGVIIWQLSARNNMRQRASPCPRPARRRTHQAKREKNNSTSSSSTPSDNITHSTTHSTPPSPRSHSTLSLNALDERKISKKHGSFLSPPATCDIESHFLSDEAATCSLKATGSRKRDGRSENQRGDKEGRVFYRRGKDDSQRDDGRKGEENEIIFELHDNLKDSQRENSRNNEENDGIKNQSYQFLIPKAKTKDTNKFFISKASENDIRNPDDQFFLTDTKNGKERVIRNQKTKHKHFVIAVTRNKVENRIIKHHREHHHRFLAARRDGKENETIRNQSHKENRFLVTKGKNIEEKFRNHSQSNYPSRKHENRTLKTDRKQADGSVKLETIVIADHRRHTKTTTTTTTTTEQSIVRKRFCNVKTQRENHHSVCHSPPQRRGANHNTTKMLLLISTIFIIMNLPRT